MRKVVGKLQVDKKQMALWNPKLGEISGSQHRNRKEEEAVQKVVK